MRTVEGFKLGYHDGEKIIEVPFNSSILSYGSVGDCVVVWMQVDSEEKRNEKKRFFLVGTAKEIKELYLQYRDTVYVDIGYTVGRIVRHVFFDPRPEGDWNGNNALRGGDIVQAATEPAGTVPPKEIDPT